MILLNKNWHLLVILSNSLLFQKTFWIRRLNNSRKKWSPKNKSMPSTKSKLLICSTFKNVPTINISQQEMIFKGLCKWLSNWSMHLTNLRPFLQIFKPKFWIWVMISFKPSLTLKFFKTLNSSLKGFKAALLIQLMSKLLNLRTNQHQKWKKLRTCLEIWEVLSPMVQIKSATTQKKLKKANLRWRSETGKNPNQREIKIYLTWYMSNRPSSFILILIFRAR